MVFDKRKRKGIDADRSALSDHRAVYGSGTVYLCWGSVEGCQYIPDTYAVQCIAAGLCVSKSLEVDDGELYMGGIPDTGSRDRCGDVHEGL